MIVGFSTVKAQYEAKFSVNSDIGCIPFTVVVTDLSGVHDTVAVNYDWGDGSPLDTAEFHTYTQPGFFAVIQTVAGADPRRDTVIVEIISQYPPEFYLFNCKGTVGSVMVRDTLYEAFAIDWGDGNTEIAPAFSLISHDYGIVSIFDVTVKGLINGSQSPNDSSNLNCYSTTKQLNMIIDIQPSKINQIQVLNTDINYGSISVDYTLIPGNNYLIEIRDQSQNAFTVIDTINQVINSTNYLLENLNTADNYYCVSITVFDPCYGDRQQSNIGCSINIQVTAENQQNVIDWETNSVNFLTYTVYKDGSAIVNIITQEQNQYIDDQVVCGNSYQYQVYMTEGVGFLSMSDTGQVTAISSVIPDPIENISATVIDQDIQLRWELPQNFLAVGYFISRSIDGVSYEILDTLSTTEYLDQGLFTQSTRYYYTITYYDACGNLSEQSITSSPILLVGEFDKTISWSDYEGWINEVGEYILEKFDRNGQLIESISLGLSTTYQEDQSSNPYQYIYYKISAVPFDIANGIVESNILEVIYRSKVAFPNAFTPDGDGLNDIFNFESRYIMAVNMIIYNRWGELVYQTTDVDKGWDGRANGKPAPIGTYIHHTELTDDMGITFIKSGEILLIR